MKKLNLCILLTLFSYIISNTHDPAFVERFQVRHITPGDQATFPQKGMHVKLHFTATCLKTFKEIESTWKKNEPKIFELGLDERKRIIPECLEIVLKEMSKGERIEFVCPKELLREYVRMYPHEDVSYDLELLNFKDLGYKTDA